MVNDWEVIKLNDFVNIKTGFPFKSKQYLEHGEGYKLLRGDNVIQGAFRWENVKLWSEDELTEKQKDYFLENGDVILAMDRPWIEAGLKTAQITNRDLPCLLVQRVARLQAKNSEDQDFLRYLISSYWFVEYLKLVQTGTAIPHISTKQILSYETKIPPLEERKKIGSLLRSLDDKIELNLQMNETLEAMAQALFKSWFVDFDPVIDNALAAGNAIPDEFIERAEQRKGIEKKENSDIQSLFPDEFEFTKEMGWIPKGWAVSNVGTEFNTVGGGTPSTKNSDFWENGDISWTTPKDLSGNQSKILLNTDRKITELGLNKISSGLLPIDTVLMSSRAPVGYLALAKVPVAINQGYIALKCEKILTPEFAIQWADSAMDEIKQRAGGTTFAEISKTNFRGIPILVPSQKIIDAYSRDVKDLYNQITSRIENINTLAKLRDTLLPKLMSGKLRIADAEALVEHV